ncbi:Acetoin utilization protein AcuC [Anoxybacillus sp. BCO1]|nr:Acetoin utilization protein AcuC [Anoxybacillus sp. BCO1]
MSKNSVFIYSDAFQTYKFHDRHPFNQLRVKLTYDLLQTVGALHDSQIVAPRLATDEELALVHDMDYIEAVKKAGKRTTFRRNCNQLWLRNGRYTYFSKHA